MNYAGGSASTSSFLLEPVPSIGSRFNIAKIRLISRKSKLLDCSVARIQVFKNRGHPAQTRGRMRHLVLLCVFTVLIASTVAHSHFYLTATAASPRAFSPALFSSSVCLLCLMAQTTTAITPMVAAFVLISSTICASPPHARGISFLHIFHLHVRPPPFG